MISKRRIAAGVAGTICVAGLAFIPGSPIEPGFEKEKKESAWGHTHHLEKIAAEDETVYSQALRSMTEFCGKKGLPAEVWVERSNFGLEVLGRCTETFRSSGP